MKRRQSLRLEGYDYRQSGLYFVTISTNLHACLFGVVMNEEVKLSAIGRIVAEEWQRTAELRHNVELDAFVVMPNHVHGIIKITVEDSPMTNQVAPGDLGKSMSKYLQANSLGAIIGRFKGQVSRRVRKMPKCRDLTVWQRNYYDHIIRNEKSLNAIRDYIAMNPSRWTEDSYHSENGSDLLWN